MYRQLSSDEIKDLNKRYSRDRLFQNLYSAIGMMCAQKGDITPEEIWKLGEEHVTQIVQTENALFEIDALPSKLHFLLCKYQIGSDIIIRSKEDISRTIFCVELVMLYQLMRYQKEIDSHPYKKYCLAILSHIQNHPLMEKIIPIIKATNERYEVNYGSELEPFDYLKQNDSVKNKNISLQETIGKAELEPITGEINSHLQLFKEAMLKAQDHKIKDTSRFLLNNTYDWVAAERLGKDIGLLRNYEQLEKILQDKRFREVPKNTQNLTKYRAYINSNTRFPNWQCSVPDAEGIFRRFIEIAKLIYSIYKLGCQKEHIKPYGSK